MLIPFQHWEHEYVILKGRSEKVNGKWTKLPSFSIVVYLSFIGCLTGHINRTSWYLFTDVNLWQNSILSNWYHIVKMTYIRQSRAEWKFASVMTICRIALLQFSSGLTHVQFGWFHINLWGVNFVIDMTQFEFFHRKW